MQPLSNFPSLPLLEEEASYCDHCNALVGGRQSLAHWPVETAGLPPAQRVDEIQETVQGTLAPGACFSSSSQESQGNHSSAWNGQFLALPREDVRIIHIEQSTLQKANRERDTNVVVYQCQWDKDGSPCHKWIEGCIRDIRNHLRDCHGVHGQFKGPARCRWLACTEELKYGSIPRHIMTHLKVTYLCSTCQQSFAREDLIQSHRKTVEKCTDAEAIVHHGPGARIIVLESTNLG